MSGIGASAPVSASAVASPPLRFKSEPDAGPAWSTALAFVVGLAVLAAWLIQRFGPARPQGAAGSRRLTVADTVWVAPKVRVSRLQCDGRSVLLASSPQGLAWLDLGPERSATEEPDHG